MKICFSVLAIIMFAAAPAAYAQEPPSSRIAVEYVHPDNFTDASYRHLAELKKHLQQRAERHIPGSQHLNISITDINMAGGFEPWRIPVGNVRIVKDIYPPRIDLRFSLTGADGVVVREGSRQLRDPAFLMTTILYRDDPLRYEKTLIDNWLERELPRPGT